jgi:glycosyltransferase involved in cell wall biosynthesis
VWFQNGYLAESNADWIEHLSNLIENKELRLQIGKAGRETVEKRYSVNANKDLYLRYLNDLIDKK